jgi:cytochrome c oxidase subunit 2
VQLSFGETQTAIALTFIGIALALVSVFLLVALRSRSEVEFERVREAGYRLRAPWLGVLIVLLGGAVAVSLFLLPYSAGVNANAEVKVQGGQFYWSMTPAQVEAGSKVRFAVTSVDVNHGFGIYSPDGELLGNVQAMPGFTNQMVLTLDQPGTYLVSCLEFCGVDHHKMTREFEVTR